MINKPDSVFLIVSGTSIIYLGLALLTRLYLPTPFNCLHTPASNRIPSALGAAGIEVYMAFQPARFIPQPGYPGHACAFTTRFHPYGAWGATV